MAKAAERARAHGSQDFKRLARPGRTARTPAWLRRLRTAAPRGEARGILRGPAAVGRTCGAVTGRFREGRPAANCLSLLPPERPPCACLTRSVPAQPGQPETRRGSSQKVLSTILFLFALSFRPPPNFSRLCFSFSPPQAPARATLQPPGPAPYPARNP